MQSNHILKYRRVEKKQATQAHQRQPKTYPSQGERISPAQKQRNSMMMMMYPIPWAPKKYADNVNVNVNVNVDAVNPHFLT